MKAGAWRPTKASPKRKRKERPTKRKKKRKKKADDKEPGELKDKDYLKDAKDEGLDGKGKKPPAHNDSAPDEKVKAIKEKYDGGKGAIEDIGELLEYVDYLCAKYDAKVAASEAKDDNEDKDEAAMNADSVDGIIQQFQDLYRLYCIYLI